VFNFIGGISKILFGRLDKEDANCYSDKINSLESEVFKAFEGTDNRCKVYAEVFELYIVGSFR
jgi:hypothetical protein